MRARTILCFVAVVPVVAVLSVILLPRAGASYDAALSSRPAGLAYAALPRVFRPFPAHPPKPTYTRRIVDVTTLDVIEKRIDKCDGPVASPVLDGLTVLIAEHDYCGGMSWIGRIKVGQAVALSGPGVETGTYVADELRYELRGKATVADLPLADVVLQTCVTKTQLVLVGMHRVA